MEKYILIADSEINLYKSKNSVRRSEVLLIDQEYLIDDCLPDMPAEDYDSYRTEIYLAEVPDKPLGWVNYKNFMNAALKSVDSDNVIEEEQEDTTTDKVSIWLEELEDEEISDSSPLTEEIVETTFTETATAQEYKVKLKNKVFSDVTGKSVNNSINSIILTTISPETTNGPITVYHNDLVYTFNRQDLIYLD